MQNDQRKMQNTKCRTRLRIEYFALIIFFLCELCVLCGKYLRNERLALHEDVAFLFVLGYVEAAAFFFLGDADADDGVYDLEDDERGHDAENPSDDDRGDLAFEGAAAF